MLGAGATLINLRRAGWRVVNLACGLGRPGDWGRRRAELEEALRRLGWEGEVLDPPASLGARDDLHGAAARVAAGVGDAVDEYEPEVVVSPHRHDYHHGHEAVAQGVEAALAQRPGSVWWTWGLWSDLRRPVIYSPVDEGVLAEQIQALRAHRGELGRNDYVELIPARARRAAILGSELVFGFGSPAVEYAPYAELLGEVRLVDGVWRTGPARVLNANDPIPEQD